MANIESLTVYHRIGHDGPFESVGVAINPKYFQDRALSQIIRYQIDHVGNPREMKLIFGRPNAKPVIFTSEELRNYDQLPQKEKERTFRNIMDMMRDSRMILLREKSSGGQPSKL